MYLVVAISSLNILKKRIDSIGTCKYIYINTFIYLLIHNFAIHFVNTLIYILIHNFASACTRPCSLYFDAVFDC